MGTDPLADLIFKIEWSGWTYTIEGNQIIFENDDRDRISVDYEYDAVLAFYEDEVM